jgi:VWFA-related protein
MTTHLRLLALCGVALAATLSAAQQPGDAAQNQSPQQPRFRAYVTVDGVPVADLAMQDFEVLEDNVPQRIESFQLVRPRGPASAALVREPNTVAESREMARDPEARMFVLFMDLWHVQLSGSYRAQAPITTLLDRVIGQDDLVGVMVPDMSARDLTFARRAETIVGILKNHWFWGERNAINSTDRREEEIKACYPDSGETEGIASEMIRRRRAAKTLNALDDLIVHLEGIREERKFVFLLSEGWLLSGEDQRLARVLKGPNGESVGPPPPPGIGIDPSGRLRMEPNRGNDSFGSCERERSLLAHTDQAHQFDQLLQRANRANVSFYPVDARGLVVFDEPIGPSRPPPPSVDAARLTARHETLRTLALNTDGYAILNTNAIDKALERVVQDTGAYYLLGYYSTNTRLDGRFRRLRVRVKREGVDVRARPGYLAPTEAELASTRVTALMNGAKPGHTTIPATVSRALERLAPARGTVPMRVHGIGAPGHIWFTGELDASLLKAAEWQQGGRARVFFQHDRGGAPPSQVEVTLAPGQSTFTATAPSGTVAAAGRYVLRVELTAKEAKVPLQTTTDVTIPEPDWLVSGTGLVSRRGPTTGLAYVSTADARFRRTERLRFEVPRTPDEGVASARLLGRDGQPLNVGVALSERSDDVLKQRFAVADLTLAPLAQGEYVIELTITQGERKDSATYGFRIIP